MNRRQMLTGSACVLVTTSSGCALIFDGAKGPDERSDQILWGWVICDLLLGFWPIIIDLVTGAIYVRKSAKSSEVEAFPAFMCADAQIALREVHRTRRAAIYLQQHLPECEHCVAAVTSARAGAATDLTDLMRSSPPDVVEEVVVIAV